MQGASCATSWPSTPSRQRRAIICAALAMLVGALLAGVTLAAPAAAQAPLLRISVTVVPASGTPAATPTGRIIVSLDGRELLAVPLGSLVAALTRATARIVVAVSLLGREVSISYSGDSNYEASDGTKLTLPTEEGVTIVAVPKDSDAPAAQIASPGQGVRYELREVVLADYTCTDPGERSLVSRCEGTVPAGAAVDTSSPGVHAFAVETRDALGNAATRTISYEVGGDAEAATIVPPPSPTPGATSGSSSTDDGKPATAPATAIVAAPGPPGTVPDRATASRANPGSPRGLAGRGASAGGAPAGAAPAGGALPAPVAVTRASSSFEPYDPRSDPAKAVGILVAAFTLLVLATLGGSGSGNAASSGQRDPDGGGPSSASEPTSRYEHGGVDYRFLGAGYGAVALGDRSRTWMWPGTPRLDAVAAAIPVRVGSRSPLIARVAADGTFLRAILGSASLLAQLAGVALGVLALMDTGGDAVPPVAALTIAIVVLGVLDAAGGFVAVLMFTSGVILSGGVTSEADGRLLFGLATLWFAVPLLAGLARPLRREASRTVEQSWDRAADFVIASLIGAWAVQKIILALPGMAGAELAIAESANAAALCALAALVVRIGLETVAAHLYPRRLDLTEATNVPQPGTLQRLVAITLRTAIFVYFARLFAGDTWQLWAGAVMFLIPQILGSFASQLPNSERLFRVLPRGVVQLVLTLFVFAVIGALLISTMDVDSPTFLADTFVIFAVPFFLLGLICPFGRAGDPRPLGWGKRIAGVALVVAGVLQVLGHLI